MDEKELQIKFQIFEQQIIQIQEQIQRIDEAVNDLTNLGTGLKELEGKKDKEILAQIGRGIFVKAKLLSEDLIVDVGDRNFVNKTIPNTQKIISDQLDKLNEVKKNLEEELDKINSELTRTMLDFQNQNPNACNCGEEKCSSERCCDENCECEEKN